MIAIHYTVLFSDYCESKVRSIGVVHIYVGLPPSSCKRTLSTTSKLKWDFQLDPGELYEEKVETEKRPRMPAGEF